MSAMYWQYLLTGILWAAYVLRMQHRLYGDVTEAWQYVLVVAANVVLWPLCIVMCIAICPIHDRRHGKANYVDTQSCRNLRK